ncbi:MAG: hypothetical protein AB1486_14320 [Planctomycetota bacterium]
MDAHFTLIPVKNTGPLRGGRGLELHRLLEILDGHVGELPLSNPNTSSARVRARLRDWIEKPEIDLPTIAERQALMRFVLDRPDLPALLETLDIDPLPEMHDVKPDHEGVRRRFDSFAGLLRKLSECFQRESSLPPSLKSLADHVARLEKQVSEVRRQLDPEFVLRLDLKASIARRSKLGSFIDLEDDATIESVYVLENAAAGSTVRARSHADFGLGISRWELYADPFQTEVERETRWAFSRQVSRSFFRTTNELRGELAYQPGTHRVTGGIGLEARKRNRLVAKLVPVRHEQFSVDHETSYHEIPEAIIAKARSEINSRLISTVESVIRDFEDVVVELRAIAALVKFYAALRSKGYPLAFPEPPEDDDTELVFEEMVHPILAHRKETAAVVPNTTRIQRRAPVVILTGAHGSGKSTFLSAVGLNVVLACAGGPVVAKKAWLGRRRRLFVLTASDGTIVDDLSSFTRQCREAASVLASLTRTSLVLSDDLFNRTGEIRESEEVSCLFLDGLRRMGGASLVATQNPRVAERMAALSGIATLGFPLGAGSAPRFEAVEGVAADSNVLAVAAQAGLEPHAIEELLERHAVEELHDRQPRPGENGEKAPA